MTPPRRRRAARRPLLESPLLAGLLLVVVAALAAVLLLPGLLGGSGLLPSRAPGSPSAAATPTPTPARPTFVRPTPSPQPTFTSYLVQPGDTLTSIARQFRTTGRSIAWWNRGAYPSLDPESAAYDPNRLEVGWTLHLLPDTVVDENNPPTPSPGPEETAAPAASAGVAP